MKKPVFSSIFLAVLCFAVLSVRAESKSGPAPEFPAAEAVEAPVVTNQLASHPAAIEIEEFWAAGKKRKAYRRLEKWKDQEEKSPLPWVEAGILRYREKKYKGGISYFDKALEKSPQCAEAYYWRGRSFEAMEKTMEAANEYRAALIAQARYQDAQDALSRVLAELGSEETN